MIVRGHCGDWSVNACVVDEWTRQSAEWSALVDCGVVLCAGVAAPTALQSHCMCHQRDDAVLGDAATN